MGLTRTHTDHLDMSSVRAGSLQCWSASPASTRSEGELSVVGHPFPITHSHTFHYPSLSDIPFTRPPMRNQVSSSTRCPRAHFSGSSSPSTSTAADRSPSLVLHPPTTTRTNVVHLGAGVWRWRMQ